MPGPELSYMPQPRYRANYFTEIALQLLVELILKQSQARRKCPRQ